MEADHYRKMAWKRLGEGGWGPSILGFVFNAGVMLTMVLTAEVLRYVAAQPIMESGVAPTAMTPELRTYMGQMFIAMVLSILGRTYFNAVAQYGWNCMAMAVMRRGASFGHALSGYGRGWRTMWLGVVAGVYVFLQLLLLIVPGIRAIYSYRMMYFVRIDHPELSADATIAESKRLMEGNRMNLFFLDLSFLGWWLFCIVTMGLGMILVHPYRMTANAAFYEDLLDKDEARDDQD